MNSATPHQLAGAGWQICGLPCGPYLRSKESRRVIPASAVLWRFGAEQSYTEAAHLTQASGCSVRFIARILSNNKTRQGYARVRILKPAGYSFAGYSSW